MQTRDASRYNHVSLMFAPPRFPYVCVRVEKNELLDMLRGGFSDPPPHPHSLSATGGRGGGGGGTFAAAAQGLQLPKATKMKYTNQNPASPRATAEEPRPHNNIPVVARVRTAQRPGSGARVMGGSRPPSADVAGQSDKSVPHR